MELKVWVEGIQRIVCGVGDGTTCQDVVFALAHATGKTGRFTLVERWRNNDRLLAPSEQPLKVLTKWGERSNDVQFILQWAPLESPGGAGAAPGNRSTIKLGSRASPDDLLQLPRRPSSQTQTQSQSQSPSNSLSGSGNGTPIPTNLSVNSRRPPSQSQLSSANINGLGSEKLNSEGSRLINGLTKTAPNLTPASTTPTIGPPPYREPPPITKQQPPGKELPPYREPPPPNLSSHPRTGSRGDRDHDSVPSPSPVSSLNSYPGSISGSSLVNSNTNTGVSGFSFSRDASANNGLSSVNGFRNRSTALRDQVPTSTTTTEMASRKEFGDPTTNGDSSSSSSSLNGVPNNSMVSASVTTASPNPMYRDLVRLINLQREKLTAQQAELTQYDAEIMYWESKAKEQQKQMDLITKEITRLEGVSTQHESQMLSLSHIEQENHLLAGEAERMRSELSGLKSEFSQCEQDLEAYQGRIRALTSEVETSLAQAAARDEERRRHDAAAAAEVDRLRKELETARRDTDAVQDLSGNLEQEVASIESVLAEKRKQMEQLVNAMKEANLQSLAILPLPSATASAQHAHPDETNDLQAAAHDSHCRSGSTRRIVGSPRQLENAAPTSKNPHGVWV